MTKDMVTETLEDLRARTGLASKFAWLMVSGMTAMCYREKGEATLVEIWRRLLTGEQKDRFLAALDKLEIRDNPPAVTAALYHYFSNSIGGLNMQVVVESPRKAWIRYMAPWGSYPGIAALAVPHAVRRTILSTWHPRNGELLGCPRLGWVATKFVSEGHPYDEGYFYEYDHDLSPAERFRVEHVEKTPEFLPEAAPKLNPETWPEARILKGGYNYGVDYVRHVIAILYELLGVNAATDIIRAAMRLLAAQFTKDLAATTGHSGTDALSVLQMFAALFAAFRNDVTVEGDSRHAVLRLQGFNPFTDAAAPELRAAVYEFFAMAVRQQNGHLRLERAPLTADGSEVWTLSDAGEWLW
jgi:hypothetical protein